VNRIFGSDASFPPHTDFEGNSHLFSARFKDLPFGTLTADLYVSVGTSLGGGLKLSTAYHCFHDDGFDLALGHETDFVVSQDLGKGFSVLAKAARFWGEGGQPDTTRASVEMGFKY